MAEPATPAHVALAAAAFRLVWAGRHRGGIGGRRGLVAGSGQDFAEFRDYAPGDDVRHIDWRGLLRSDQPRVRLFEAEVAPLGDVIVDRSASMAVTEAKAAAVRDLAHLFGAWVRREGGSARWLELGGGVVADPAPSAQGAAELRPPTASLRPRALRVVISDFLVADDPAPLLRSLAAGAGSLVALQVLDPWEMEPAVGEPVTLIDSESGERLDWAMDRAAVDRYRQRLERLQAHLRGLVLSLGGRFAVVAAAEPAAMCRASLLPASVVEPRR